MPCATSKKTTPPGSRGISRTERGTAKPRAVTIRPLKRAALTAKQFDEVALAHGARPLTASEKRTLIRAAVAPGH